MTNGVVPTMVGQDAFAESNSVAIGNGALALSGNSLAIGPGEFSGTYDDDGLPIYNSSAFAGTNAIAIKGTASGADSVTVGGVATADYATSIGESANASALGTLALGSYAIASEAYAVALGTDASAYGGSASALGRAATAIGGVSIAIGPNSSAGGSAACAIGYGAVVPIGLNSTVEVGEGTAVSNGWFHYRGNAVIDPNGKVYGPTGEYTTPEQHATKLTATWNPEFNTYDISLLNGVVGQLFQENHVYVKNKSGYTLEEGRAVKIMGSVGDQVLAGYASSDDQQSKWCTIGIVTSTGGIANDTNGYVTTFGNVNDLNTTGLTVSNAVWLSTNGFLTITEPNITSVTSKVCMGMVLREHANQGRIFVSVKTVPNWTDVGAIKQTGGSATDLTVANLYVEGITNDLPIIGISPSNSVLTGTTSMQNATISGSLTLGGETRSDWGSSGASTIYKPITDYTPSSTQVVTVVSTQAIYRVTATNAFVLRHDLSALSVSGRAAEWQTWIDYQTTNALSTVWSNMTFAAGVPDFAGSCTGTYKFACSTLDGTNVSAVQTFPTPYGWEKASYGTAAGTAAGRVYDAALSASATSATYYASNPYPCCKFALMYDLRASTAEASASNVVAYIAIAEAGNIGSVGTNATTVVDGSASTPYNYAPVVYVDSPVSIKFSALRFDLRRQTTIGSGNILWGSPLFRRANELEVQQKTFAR
jgi:hypothetical protein